MTDHESIIIRRAGIEDAASLARLSHQLGYPDEIAENIREHLIQLLPDNQHCILVAETSRSELAGWLHAFVVRMLQVPFFVEIGGLVVDAAYRRSGVGKSLITAAEEWALATGLQQVNLRSRINRLEAHEFYPSIGYTHTKTQKTYEKILIQIPPGQPDNST